jgi:hypothetical protein
MGWCLVAAGFCATANAPAKAIKAVAANKLNLRIQISLLSVSNPTVGVARSSKGATGIPTCGVACYEALIVKVAVTLYDPCAYFGSLTKLHATEPVFPPIAEKAPAPKFATG